jgi:hypothetical protein
LNGLVNLGFIIASIRQNFLDQLDNLARLADDFFDLGLKLRAGGIFQVHLVFFASSIRPGSRSDLIRSGGTPGAAIIGRPISPLARITRVRLRMIAGDLYWSSKSNSVGTSAKRASRLGPP